MIFHSCFIKKRKNSNTVSKPWITKRIKTSCNLKRELYLKARDSNDLEFIPFIFHFIHLQVQPMDVEIVIKCYTMYLLNYRCQITEYNYNTMITQ